jgi:hypothetical protein
MKSIILYDFEVRNALKNDLIQIRRPIKPLALSKHLYWKEVKNGIVIFDNGETGEMRKCPFGQPGDRLWVKETFASAGWDSGKEIFVYKADLNELGRIESENMDEMNIRLKPSIHMTRETSRITLEVDEIRVEPVQNITEDDAEKEGIDPEFEMSVEEFYNKQISPN